MRRVERLFWLLIFVTMVSCDSKNDPSGEPEQPDEGTFDSSDLPSAVAVIVQSPTPTAVTIPLFTVAIEGLSLLHVTVELVA